MSDPREGLPPCFIRAARLDDRVAWWAEANRCSCWNISAQRDIAFGMSASPDDDKSCARGWTIHPVGGVATDDPDEAQAAFERGAEWVRTGDGP